MPLTPGTRLGPHEILGPLGAGGMGEVYLARDTRLDRDVALKLLPQRMAHDSEAITRFRREALTLASLNHPNIATVFGFEESPDGPMVLVLEHVEGETLHARLRRGALPVEGALQICAQVAQALEVAHERGVIHRDVKPSNVMIGPRGLVKVLDFGLARKTRGLGRRSGTLDDPPSSADGRPSSPPTPAHSDAADAETLAMPALGPTSDAQTLSASGMALGTPGYMSPEQVMAEPLDERADVFALGCVLYECLAGRRAFSGSDAVETMRATLDRAADGSALPAGTPARVRTLIERCLEKDRANRPPAIRDVRLELEDLLGVRRASRLREGEVDGTPNNLPVPATGFVGRVATLAACSGALEGSRLLTLVGMGGSGKTRLALRLAETRLAAFPDGLWFVDVAPLAEPERVVEVLAAALGVREDPGRTLLQGLTDTLATRRTLVLLDNAESHLAACGQLAEHLLRTCRELRLLSTSREPLGADGETVFTVPTLEVPAARAAAPAVASSESVLLFVERARAASPDFELTDANLEAVAEICRRLDGIPLALELAAARVRLLGVEQIRARLGDRFKLLTRGAGSPSRQQTVLAMIQWSWDHLLPPEQDVMRRLAVFTGGWTLERATLVCSETGDEFEVLDLLSRLAERSLVVVTGAGDGSPRYRFLESVWRFALDQLQAHAEHEVIRERHLAAYLALAERSEKAMTGPGLAAQLVELEPEEENLLAALVWCPRAADGAQRGLRLAASVSRFWSVKGRFATGRRAMEEALAHDTARAPTPERAKALTRAAGLALLVGAHDAAHPYLEEGLALSRAAADRKGMARAISGLGVVAMARSRFEEALAIVEESLTLYQELGEQRGVAMALHNLGSIESVLSRPGHGRTRLESAALILRVVSDVTSEALCLSALSSSLVRNGELEAARRRLLECLALLRQVEAPREGLFVLEALVEWLIAIGRAPEAARFEGACEAARTALGTPHMPYEKVDAEKRRARIVELLGAAGAEQALAAGRTLTLSQGLAEAATLLDRSGN